ncbi:MAG: L,D-transpeptidase [Myxococcales bacterium]|nr:L,D-transpeptidase [Myxococcales bacterium]MCB9576078.1 L,D-transpeptidase [Polyangiaceae bacterium]
MRRAVSFAIVVIAASAHAEPVKPSHVYSRGVTTWIYETPRKSTHDRLGYIRLGEGVRVRSAEPTPGPGCSEGFYPVEPFGWVCADRLASLRMQGRYLNGMQLAHSSTALMPFQYALSNGAPMYRRLPTRAEWEKEERFLGKPGTFRPQSWGNRGHEKLAEVRAIPATDSVPWFLADGGSVGREKPHGLVRRTIPHGSMLSFTRAFSYEGRTWLLSADGTVVPADRVRPFRVSQFHGTPLGKGVELPIAFFREKARPKYVKTGEGFAPANGEWAVRSFVSLDPRTAAVEVGKKRYLATREKDEKGRVLWTDEADATVVRRREQRPIGVAEGEKWLLISITSGTLVAYDADKPVYATLVSPGVGGVPMPGKDPVKMSTTPMGVYRVTFKHRAATMSPEQGENRSFWIADVPYTQYFNAPFALHTAYWHESFGEPMSAGCVNLSPIDGRYLFEFTDPKVPAGWNGAAPGGPLGKGTYVVVSR